MNNQHIAFLRYSGERINPCWQWDKGQKIVFDKEIADGTELQFADGTIVLVDNNQASIPDKLLQKAGDIFAWIQVIDANSETTMYQIVIPVNARSRKNDYIEPEDEPSFREQIEERFSEIQQTIPSEERINALIDEKLGIVENAEY